MLPIFNYNSRSFTILAIILLVCLAYYSNKDKSPSVTPDSAAGARYVMEIDPNNADKTWWERAILFVFGGEINKKIERNKQLKELPSTLGTTTDGYVSKFGDKVLIVYYSTNPMPPFMPSPEEVIIGKNNLPKDVDKMLAGLRVGDKREFRSGNTNYHIELISVIEPARESVN